MEEIKKEKLELQRVKSSNIMAIGYNIELETLYIMFGKSGIYKYNPMKEDAYESFLNAKSIGKFFFAFIKSNKLYKCEKMDPIKLEIEFKEN